MAAYIPPENSPLHDIYDIDFFQKIETEASYFSQYGEVYLIGDLNSRVGNAPVICISGSLGAGDSGDIAWPKCRDLMHQSFVSPAP